MAKKPESVHVNWIRDKVKEAGIAYPVKIANDSENGMPDNLYIPSIAAAKNDGQSLWVEYKFMEEWPVRDSTIVKPKFNSGLQEIWAKRIYESDAEYAVVIFVGRGVKTECLWLRYSELEGFEKGVAVGMALSRQDVVNRIHYITSNGAEGRWPKTKNQ